MPCTTFAMYFSDVYEKKNQYRQHSQKGCLKIFFLLILQMLHRQQLIIIIRIRNTK